MEDISSEEDENEEAEVFKPASGKFGIKYVYSKLIDVKVCFIL